ncbi:MAG TPA: tripartite tricarboxylate transporter substrate binding protein [Burkholderiales bacterium]|nr:tripartite tricarboxylate transporter substrate binding protein [Burkholderiales bacterium]
MSRRVRIVGAMIGAIVAVPGLGVAQTYPSKPLRIIVPFPPGAATDITGRFIAQKLGEALGQQAIVDNRPGANGTIGLELAAKAPPDGHTLVIGQTGNLAISPGLTRVGYDPVRDFAPISLAIASPHVLAAHPSLPVRSLQELVSLARARPGQLNYASTGSGSAGHLGMELLKKATRMEVVHVPYKGGTPGLMDLAAGHVALMFTSVLSTSQVGNRVRRLAVGSLQRSPSLPDVPTIAESGYPGFEVISWWGILGQAAMPKEIVARLNNIVVKGMASADAQKRIGALGADIKTNTPEQFAEYIRRERAKWGQAIRDSGARID